VQLPVASYSQPSRNASRLVNCLAQVAGKAPAEIVATPGAAVHSALGGAGRGFAVLQGILYAVCGETLYRVSDGSSVGTIPGSGTLTFSAGVSQLVTDTGYLFSGTTSLITDEDKVPWSVVDFVDGYLLYVEKDSGRFGGSALNDSSSYDGLDFATAEGSPDKLVTMKVDHRDVLLFGTDSTEVWNLEGGSGFPFVRQSGGFIELGCLARLSVAKADNSVFWLASDRTFRRLSGRTPVKVSQVGVEEALSRYSTVSDCEAVAYTFNGQVTIQWHFPTEGATWCLNITTGEWFEQDYRYVAAITHEGKTWVQAEDGTIGYLTDAPTVFGNPVTRTVQTGHVFAGSARVFISQLDALMRTGDVDPEIVPMLQLDVSYDGGNEWHSFPAREMGRAGGYRQIVRWTRLGAARDIVVRLRCSDPVPFIVTGLELEAQGGEK
jgi:hypothetical protein